MNESLCCPLYSQTINPNNCFLLHFKDEDNPCKDEYGHIFEKMDTNGTGVIVTQEGYFNNKALRVADNSVYRYKLDEPLFENDFTFEYISQVTGKDSYYGYNEIVLCDDYQANVGNYKNTFYFSWGYGRGELTMWFTGSDGSNISNNVDLSGYSSDHGRIHFALVRKSKNIYFYVNGVCTKKLYRDTEFNPNSIIVGNSPNASTLYDELRIVPFAVYEYDFTPPTQELEAFSSETVLSTIPEYFISPSGRKMYRHSSNKGTVIECDVFGKPTKLFVADSEYWFTSVFTSVNVATAMPRTPVNIYPISGDINTDEQIQTRLKAKMGENHGNYNHTRLLCNKWIEEVKKASASTTAPEGILRARSINIIDETGLDIPTFYEGAIIFAESEMLFKLDPTMESSRIRNLTPGVCDATSHNNSSMIYVCADGHAGGAAITGQFNVIPVRELGIE